MYAKNIRDQIIEGLVDGNTVEDLLQQKDLTLEVAITKRQAQEAAKRQRAEMARDASESIVAIRKTQPEEKVQTCPGCGAGYHPGGR